MRTAPAPELRRALIVVADPQGTTMTIAHALRDRLRRRGHAVDVSDVTTTAKPTAYDAVIIGTQLGQRRDRRMIGEFIAAHREGLNNVASGLFMVGTSRDHMSRRHLEAFSSAVSWQPQFAAALRSPERTLLRLALRAALIAMLRRVSGSNDITEPDDVSALADVITRELRRVCPDR